MIRQSGAPTLQPEEVLRARIGLSGLSEVMQREGPAIRPTRDGTHAPRNAATNTGPTTAQRLAARRQRQAKARRLRWLIGVAIGLVVTGGLLWFILSASGLLNTRVDPAIVDGAGEPPLPVLKAEPQTAEAWTRLSPAPYDKPTYVVDELFLDAVRVTPTEDGHVLNATVRTELFSSVDQALVTLMIVNDQNEFIARALVQVSLVQEDRPRPLRVHIPSDLWPDDGHARVEGWVDVTRRLERPFNVTTPIQVQPTPTGDGSTRLAVTLQHPDDPSTPTLKRLVVLLFARDTSGQTVATWRVQLTQTIEPGDVVEFLATVPLDPAAPPVGSWFAQAAGDAKMPPIPASP